MAETIGEEITGKKGLEGPDSQFILMLNHPQELNHLFQVGFFNWIGQGIIQPRPERPPFQPQHVPGIPVPPHVSLQPEVPKNDGWHEIVHPLVSHHHGWPNLSLPPPPPHVKLNVQISPAHSPV